MRNYRLKQNPEEILPFVITLERATLRQMRDALDSARNRDYIVVEPVWFPIWFARYRGKKGNVVQRNIILQGDGMADYPLEALGDKTPLEAARTPNMDWLAPRGVYGLAHVIRKGFPPGSDVGNMSIMGYDPAVYHTGRSPLEATSMGVALGSQDIAFRCNLVTFAGSGSEATMEDFTSGHISTEEAREIIRDLGRELAGDGIEFFPASVIAT